MPDLYVTNFHRRFTGVSATAAAVVAHQATRYDMQLVGDALPRCPAPIPLRRALSQTAHKRPFTIWHVRRNAEMWAGLIARDVLRKPVKLVFTSAAIRRHSAVPRWLISKMDAVIATTQTAAEFVPHVAAIVPHGVPTSLIMPAQNREAAWQGTGFTGQRGVATIGRIRPEKGTDRFVDAMIEALPQSPGTTALVIGKATKAHASFEAGLRKKVADAGLSARILFVGELPTNALHALLPALSAVVQLPTYEGYGMVPLEAMAAALPFVATDAGHYRAFSDGETCGRIVPAKDAARTLLEILKPEIHTKMSAAARQRAVAAYDITTEVDGIAGVYDRLWAGETF